LPPHTTLEVATFKNIDSQRKDELTEEFKNNIYFDSMTKLLRGFSFSFDTTVLAGRDVYICAGRYSANLEPIQILRNKISQVMASTIGQSENGEASGATMPINYQNILHSTIARISEAPDDVEVLESYAREVDEQIKKPLSENPLKVVVDNVYHGSALAYHLHNSSPRLLA
jgi:hypothetical protein